MRILSLILNILVVSTSSIAAAQLSYPEKVGIGTWESDKSGFSLAAVEELKFGWYYTWRTTPLWHPDSSVSRQVPFVPMIWGANNVNETPPRASGMLLGFNEPNLSSQANMTVEKAIELWPKLMATGLRLCSPAPTTGQALSDTSWLGRFMAQASTKGYRVDDICVHWYTTSKDVGQFKTYLEQVYAKYKRPIWVTEWALVDWTHNNPFSFQETAAYAKSALPMLDSLPYVKGHAWFAGHNDGSNINTELFDQYNKITPVGQVFKEALSATVSPTPEVPAPIDPSVNLIANPGFEASLDHWQNWGNSSAVTGNAASGSYSVRTGAGQGGVAQNVMSKLVAGATYRLQASAKLGASGEQAWIGIKFSNSSGSVLLDKNVLIGTTSYSRITVDFSVPAGAAVANVYVWKSSGSSYVYADDVSLIALSKDPSPPLTPSPVDTEAPKVSLTSPSDGASFSTRTTITLSATASDNVGVSKVVFLVNGREVCTAGSAPYSCKWATPKKRGTQPFEIKARAHDAAGNTGLSSAAFIMVN